MARLTRLALLAALAATPACAADATSGPITVSAPWSRATFGPGATGIAYMTIDNAGPADALTGLTCDGAATTTLHDEKNGTMMMPGMSAMRTDSMPLLDQIPLPAKSRIVLKPGGLHAMLENMTTGLDAGKTEACMLHFRTAAPLPITLKIARAGASTPPK